MNQCDGCKQQAPLNYMGLHIDNKGVPFMVCTAYQYNSSYKYECKEVECCCKCIYQYKLMSHPWVNSKSMSNQIGYVCVMPDFNDKAIMSREHGGCECFLNINTDK